MTLLETSLSLIFMGMFFAALFAASQGIDRLTRGYTCRILSSDPRASMPERGCPGQVDEVLVNGVGMLKLVNQSALRALRDDLINHASLLSGLAISAADLDLDLQSRQDVLRQKCLWEKITPAPDRRFSVQRNYLEVAPDALRIEQDPETNPLPAPAARAVGRYYWFIRAGRLMGERVDANGLAQPVEGMQAVDDALVSVNPTSGSVATTQHELTAEPTGTSDELEGAPNSNWGLINQVCLYQGASPLGKLYLLSAERGQDLEASTPPFFGREVGVASRQPQPRLLFYAPSPP
jgi:hypothetical protein